jgi:hypothetical protein
MRLGTDGSKKLAAAGALALAAQPPTATASPDQQLRFGGADGLKPWPRLPHTLQSSW